MAEPSQRTRSRSRAKLRPRNTAPVASGQPVWSASGPFATVEQAISEAESAQQGDPPTVADFIARFRDYERHLLSELEMVQKVLAAIPPEVPHG